MTASLAPSQRVVILQRAARFYPDGYWTTLLGLDVRMPALVSEGRVLAGFLVGVSETEEVIELTFAGLEVE